MDTFVHIVSATWNASRFGSLIKSVLTMADLRVRRTWAKGL